LSRSFSNSGIFLKNSSKFPKMRPFRRYIVAFIVFFGSFPNVLGQHSSVV